MFTVVNGFLSANGFPKLLGMQMLFAYGFMQVSINAYPDRQI